MIPRIATKRPSVFFRRSCAAAITYRATFATISNILGSSFSAEPNFPILPSIASRLNPRIIASTAKSAPAMTL